MSFTTIADLLADPVLGKLDEVRALGALRQALAHCDGDGTFMGRCSDCPTGDEVCCTGDGPPSDERVVVALDAALLAVANARGTCEGCRFWESQSWKPLCTATQMVDIYGEDDLELVERRAIAFWASNNEYGFHPPADFGCSLWEARKT